MIESILIKVTLSFLAVIVFLIMVTALISAFLFMVEACRELVRRVR